jgi:hypothetical protein
MRQARDFIKLSVHPIGRAPNAITAAVVSCAPHREPTGSTQQPSALGARLLLVTSRAWGLASPRRGGWQTPPAGWRCIG